ncbi:MAG: 50S ribosomal protein L22 [Nitrospirae bacterium]|nr:50S ribosomal protein L22 [Nitrospirota bacterium]
MEATATSKYQRVGARKARLVVDLIRGARAGDALNHLKFMPHAAARLVEKVLKSAIANAEDRQIGDVDDLVVTRIWVDQGPMQKRIHPSAQGRANRILKRSSHITVVVAAGDRAK